MVDLNDHQFKVAFSVDRIENGKKSPINDPDFVEWGASIGDTIVNVHKCTDEDYSEFHEIVDG